MSEKVYLDMSDGWLQGVRVVRSGEQVLIVQYYTDTGDITDTVVIMATGEARAVADAIINAADDDEKERRRADEQDKLQRLVDGRGLPGGDV